MAEENNTTEDNKNFDGMTVNGMQELINLIKDLIKKQDKTNEMLGYIEKKIDYLDEGMIDKQDRTNQLLSYIEKKVENLDR